MDSFGHVLKRKTREQKKPVVVETTGFSSGPSVNNGLAQTIEFSTAPGMYVYIIPNSLPGRGAHR